MEGRQLPPDMAVETAILQRVAAEQQNLFGLLDEAGRDLDATQARVNFDLHSANKSVDSLMDLMSRTLEANSTALQNAENAQALSGGFPGVESAAGTTIESMAGLNESIGIIRERLANADVIASAGQRADANMQAMRLIKPRLQDLEHRVDSVEERLYSGNLTRLVDETVDNSITGVIEDVGRGLTARLPEH